MKKLSIILCLLMMSLSLCAQVQKNIEDIIRRSSALKGAMVGVMAVTEDGDTIASMNCDVLFQPASTMKLITTGTALGKLGATFRFETLLACSGSIDAEGDLYGDIFIIGGGDPSLCSDNPHALSKEAVFSKWAGMISNAGIKKINGRIVADGSFLGGERENQHWMYEDIGTAYGSGMSGLSFDENMLRIKASPGVMVGDSLTLVRMKPQTPWLSIEYYCLTGEKGTGDKLYLFTTDNSTKAQLRGTFALGKSPKVVEFSNKYPEYTLVYEFSEYLKEKGISTDGVWAEPSPIQDDFYLPEDEQLVMLGAIESPELSSLVKRTNFESNNFYAESIFRTVAKESGMDGSYEDGAKAEMKALKEMGVGTKGVSIDDGSGLSRTNYASPAFFCKFLTAMTDCPVYKAFLASIPQVGVSGTVANRLGKLPDAKKRRVFMKSGSQQGVCCYCGYIMPATSEGKTITFSVMVNNFDTPAANVRNAVDDIISAMF